MITGLPMLGKTISHYHILEKIGEGGMGIVYLAEDTVLGRRVAIKTLTSGRGDGEQHFRSRFLREARAISKLSHPHIANIYDYGETQDGQPYIVMELVSGSTLSELMAKEKLTIQRALEIIKQVAEALSEAHRNGIIHRDIKPSNVAINERDIVKVLDFGLAKEIETIPTDPEAQTKVSTQTREGVVVGTPMYLSPEQALGLKVDARSDVFSLGGLLYECVAGKPPFTGKTAVEICAKVVRDDPPPPSHYNPAIPSKLDQIALKALAKKPEQRYQTTDEMIAVLEVAIDGLRDGESDGAVTRRISTHHGEHTTGPLATLSDIFKRPRLSVGYVAAAAIILTVVALGVWWLTKPKLKVPKPEAQRLYDQAVDALRASAFFKASKMLQQAIAQDEEFVLAHARLAEAWTEMDYSEKAKDELIQANRLVVDRSVLSESDAMRLDAITSVVQRDFGKAIEHYRALAANAPDSEKAFALVDLGRAYEKDEQPTKAIESYIEASKRNPQYPTPFLRLGVAYGRQQKFAEAYAAFDQAYKLYEPSSEIEGQAEVFLQRGVLLGQQGKTEEARVQLDQALQRAVTLEHKDKQIRVLLNLSNNLIVAGDPTKAEEYSRQALQLAQAIGVGNLTTAGLIDIGNAHLLRGNFGEAESYYNQALHQAQFYKGKRNEARASIMLASLRSQQNRPDEIPALVTAALSYYEQGGHRKEISQAYLLLGRAYDEIGDYDNAEKTFKQQLQRAQGISDAEQIGLASEGLGSVAAHRQNYPSALSNYDEKYKVSKSLNKKFSVGYAAESRGSILWQLGQFDEARNALQEALNVAENGGRDPYKELLTQVHLSTANMLLSQRRTGEAIKEGERALSLSQPDFKALAVRANSTLGIAKAMTGQSDAGRKHCEDAVQQARTLRDPVQLSQALLTLAEVALIARDPQAALSAASECEQRFAAARQNESEWRALTLMGLATEKVGDKTKARELGSRAKSVLELLEQAWGSQHYASYLARPDIQELHRKLSALLA